MRSLLRGGLAGLLLGALALAGLQPALGATGEPEPHTHGEIALTVVAQPGEASPALLGSGSMN